MAILLASPLSSLFSKRADLAKAEPTKKRQHTIPSKKRAVKVARKRTSAKASQIALNANERRALKKLDSSKPCEMIYVIEGMT
jgi:hypothetical protein